MKFEGYSFGSVTVDGVTYHHDIVVDRGKVQKRKKKPSKQFREDFGHTPLSLKEEIPWSCRHLVIGTGAMGALPVMDDVKREAKRRGVKLTILPTGEALKLLRKEPGETNAVLHLTC